MHTAVMTGSGGCQYRPDAAQERAAAPEAHERDAAHHLTLGVDAAARAGIGTTIAEASAGTTEVEAFGRVLDPLPLVTALHARDAARIVTDVARAEYERVARLHREDQNASTRDLEAARGALDKAALDLADATARLTLGWGSAAEPRDALVDDLIAARAALIRIDLPAGVTVTPPPTTVTVRAAANPALHTVARILGRAPTTDPLVQGDGYLAFLTGDLPRPGTVLSVTVLRDATPQTGVEVPPAAVVWVDGAAAVYVEPTAGEFERRTVTLGPRAHDRWIVTAGLAAGERFVVTGAARLLSSEMMGPEPGPAAD